MNIFAGHCVTHIVDTVCNYGILIKIGEIHGSKALFRAVLIWASHGDGATYKASFFGASQVQPIEA